VLKAAADLAEQRHSWVVPGGLFADWQLGRS
jgi:hypothetical protein